MKKCKNPTCRCNKHNRGFFDDDSHCPVCGSKLSFKEETKCCCGHHLYDGDVFCSGCGLSREEDLKTKSISSPGFIDISGEKLNPTVEDIELAISYIGKSEREEIIKNNARLDAILEKWGYSIPIRENEPPVPVEKVKQLIDELKEFIDSLPPPSRRR